MNYEHILTVINNVAEFIAQTKNINVEKLLIFCATNICTTFEYQRGFIELYTANDDVRLYGEYGLGSIDYLKQVPSDVSGGFYRIYHSDLAEHFCWVRINMGETGSDTLSIGLCHGTEFSDDFASRINPLIQFLKHSTVQVKNNIDIERHNLNFVANMGHEVRTPLNAIVTITDLLLNDTLTSTQLTHLNIIKVCSIQLTDILNDILDFSKIISNGIKLKLEPISILACFNSVYSILLPKANEKTIHLEYNIDVDVPDMVIGDPIRIKQVLLNIISNAIKFTPQGNVTVNVQTISVENNITTLFISICDTGIGINPEHIPTLFTPFRQINTNYLSENCGIGLGLFIAQTIVNLFNGSIWIESVPSKGTIVNIKLPLPVYHSAIDMPSLVDYFLNKQILIFDTETSDRALLFKLMADFRFKPIITSTIDETIMYLQQPQYEFEFILINEKDMKTNDFLKIQQIKNTFIKVIIVDNNMSVTSMLTYDYKLIRPINESKFTGLLNMIYISNQYNPVRMHNEVIDGQTRLKLTSLNPTIRRPSPTIHILVVEDNKYNQYSMVELLRMSGYTHIHVANNGQEALTKMQSQLYQVVFMDLKMPGMSGIETTKKYNEWKQANVPTQKLPFIIAVTANLAVEVKRDCIDAKMDGFITKPVDKNDLEKVIQWVSQKWINE